MLLSDSTDAVVFAGFVSRDGGEPVTVE
jgi:hypothetical protein